MMYSNRLVACVKVAGKILRESGDIVTLPFGSEYSLLIKNLNSVRVQVKVSVDGTDATEGTWLVINPNASLELERFIRNGNWNNGNRFKFIERTEQIEWHRGIGSDDGLIRIEWARELVVPKPIHVPVIHDHYDDYDEYPWVPRPHPWYPRPYPRPWRREPFLSRTPSRSLRPSARSGNVQASSGTKRSAKISFSNSVTMDFSSNDTGITVPGSISNQQFVPTSSFAVEQIEVLIIRLRGKVGDVAVAEPVTVQHKPQCSTCGRVNKGGSQFCSQCGTALTLA